MTSKIPVSVVIPAYRRERYIQDAVLSVLDCDVDRSSYEILLVSDGVSSPLEQWLKERGVVVITTEAPSVGALLAAGVTAAHGEVVAFLDDDDRYHREKLRTVMETFADPNVVFYHHAFQRVDEEGQPFDGPSELSPLRVPFHLPVARGAIGQIRRMGGFYNCSSIAVRRSALLPRVSALRQVTNAQDFSLFLLLSPPGIAIVDGTRVLTDFRTHVSQGTHMLEGDALPASHVRFLEGTVRSFESIRQSAPTVGGQDFALCREESYDTLLWTMTGQPVGNGQAPWVRSIRAIVGNLRERDIRNAAILTFLVSLSAFSRRTARRFYVPLKRVEMASLGLIGRLASPGRA